MLRRVIVSACVLWSSVAMAQNPPGPPTVDASGFGDRRVTPDRATVTVAVDSKAMSASQAAFDNGKASQSVRDTLRAMGLDTAVSVASFNVGQNYEPNPRGESLINGYVARTSIRIRLSRMDLVGKVIDAALSKGGTGVSVSFEASNAEVIRREALADAANKAKLDAEALAKALGGSLGPLVSSTTSNYPVQYATGEIAMLRTAVAGGTVAVPNDILIRAQVNARWQFIPNPR